ncbi:MAG: DUF805 domain-containing protein [Muribaculaceae bacterium]|nr:DUF805 domain-containing protein [Muribaculaceae bacterium]
MELNNENNPVLNQEPTHEPMNEYQSTMPQALPMIEFWEAVGTCFRKFIDFKGRARRSEFWWFMLFVLLVALLCSFLDGFLSVFQGVFLGPVVGFSFIGLVEALVLFFPAIAVTFRRLHDTGRSGWWIGGVFILVAIGLIGMYFIKTYKLGETAAFSMWLPIILAIFIIHIIVLISCVSDSHPGENKYGPSPKYQQSVKRTSPRQS